MPGGIVETTYAHEVVTKIEAAERQLRVAIRLFFERKDMIAVHTLATAAQQIFVDLGKPLGINSIFDNEKLKQMRGIFRASQNFLKHADSDPEAKLPFFPDATKFHLFDAAVLNCRLTKQMLAEVTGFLGWFMNQHPHLFDTTDFPDMASAIDLAKSQNFHDFDLILISIDKDLDETNH
jgi:hypothetical protein